MEGGRVEEMKGRGEGGRGEGKRMKGKGERDRQSGRTDQIIMVGHRTKVRTFPHIVCPRVALI